jgi:hypothetical protein
MALFEFEQMCLLVAVFDDEEDENCVSGRKALWLVGGEIVVHEFGDIDSVSTDEYVAWRKG